MVPPVVRPTLIFFFLMIRRPPRSTLFPTRRSSDLSPVPSPSRIWWWPSPSAAACAKLLRVFTKRADRKSTRLNSSHLVISYAVFCLKKKISLLEGELQHLPDAPQHSDPGDCDACNL